MKDWIYDVLLIELMLAIVFVMSVAWFLVKIANEIENE